MSVAVLHAVNACIAMQWVGCAHNHSGPIHDVLVQSFQGFIYSPIHTSVQCANGTRNPETIVCLNCCDTVA